MAQRSLISYMNQEHRFATAFTSLVIAFSILGIYGWISFQILSPLSRVGVLAHYGATAIAVAAMVVATILIAIRLNNPKRTKSVFRIAGESIATAARAVWRAIPKF